MPNMLDEVTPKILAQGLLALRATCVMPRLVNRSYDNDAQKQGASVDIPIPSAIKVRDVVPSPNAPNTDDVSPDSINLPLNEWKEAAFYLTDKDKKEIMAGVIPMQVSEAVSAIADHVDGFILNLGLGAYSATGTPGTDPFSTGGPNGLGSTRDATQSAKILNELRTPLPNRRMVIDPAAQASAIELRAMQDVSWNGSQYGIDEGMVNHRLGFDWFMDQNVPRHETTASLSDWTINGAHQVGATSLTLQSGATLPAFGDLFTIAGQSQTYVVKSVSGNVATISPALKVAVDPNTAITFFASHVLNLAFHRDAIAFASRPLTDSDGMGNAIMSHGDPVSGLNLRLEISRENKRTRYSFDILFGGVLVRPEFINRVMG